MFRVTIERERVTCMCGFVPHPQFVSLYMYVFRDVESYGDVGIVVYVVLVEKEDQRAKR